MKYILKIFILLFSVISVNAIAQNSDFETIKGLEISDSLKIIKIDSLLVQNLKENKFDNFSVVSKNYSIWLYRQRNYKKGLEVLKQSILHNTEDIKTLQYKNYFAGVFSYLMNDYKRSNEFFLKSVSLINDNNRAAQSYTELGSNYYVLGDYALSIQYYETAERLYTLQDRHDKLPKLYIDSSNSYKALETDETKMKLFSNLSKADSILHLDKKKPVKEQQLIRELKLKQQVKKALGRYYYSNPKAKDTVQGLIQLAKSLEYAIELKDSIKVAGVYSDLGVLFNQNDQQKTISYFNQAIKNIPKKATSTTAYIHGNLGRSQAIEQRFDEAISSLEKATQLITGTTKAFAELSASEKTTLLRDKLNDNNQLWVLSGYIAETYLLQYEVEKTEQSLINAIEYFKITDELFDYYNLNLTNISSKLTWRKAATELYGRALKACYLAKDYESAFFFMEKNKALLLAEQVEKQRRQQSFNFPIEVYKTELELKKNIGYLEKEITSNKTNIKASQELLILQENLNSYWDSVSVKYPSYIPLKENEIETLATTQNKLSKNQIILEYHISVDDGSGIYPNENNGYVLIITKDKNQFLEIQDLSQLKEDVTRFSQLAKTPFQTNEDISSFTRLSNRLYKRLFPTEEIRDSILDKELILIPDNYLSFVPFEALSISEDAIEYLIIQTEIHYTYSNSFAETTARTTKSNSKFLGFAPVEFKALGLSKLSNSGNEIEHLQNYYNGTSYLEERATKMTFLNELTNYGILHLATHADAQDAKSPWIAFRNEKLELEELYLTQNNASLVVLSGCNTSLGEQATGEGVMSLARGFFHSGAQSVISTLWSIDDTSTALIIDDFYKNLSDGQTKSKALHNAKLNYLNTHSLSDASPHYWASFILLGENNELANSPNYLFIFILLGVSILFFVLYLKKFQNKK